MLDAAPDARFPRRLYHPHTSLPPLPHLKSFLPLASVMCRRLCLLWRQEAVCCRLCLLVIVARACRLCFLLPLLLVASCLAGGPPFSKESLCLCHSHLSLVSASCRMRPCGVSQRMRVCVSQLACCTCGRVLTKDCLQIAVNVARAGVPEKLAEMDIVVDVGAVHTHTHTHSHTHTHILDNVCVCVVQDKRESLGLCFLKQASMREECSKYEARCGNGWHRSNHRGTRASMHP